MKDADLMGGDVSVNFMDCIAKATKNFLNVRYARSAMNIFYQDGGGPKNSTAAMHDYWRQTPKARGKSVPDKSNS